MAEVTKTAVLLTVFNRREMTLVSLRTLYAAIDRLGPGYAFDVYLVDDGSTDGSGELCDAYAEKDSRSLMNVTFTTPNEDRDKSFVSEAAERGLVSLKGHRLVGGLRSSIYNAMPKDAVEKLVEFMDGFAKENAL